MQKGANVAPDNDKVIACLAPERQHMPSPKPLQFKPVHLWVVPDICKKE